MFFGKAEAYPRREHITIYKWSKKARVFGPDKTFKPSLMFVGKVEAYPRGEHITIYKCPK
jgi:hypothetical protein